MTNLNIPMRKWVRAEYLTRVRAPFPLGAGLNAQDLAFKILGIPITGINVLFGTLTASHFSRLYFKWVLVPSILVPKLLGGHGYEDRH